MARKNGFVVEESHQQQAQGPELRYPEPINVIKVDAVIHQESQPSEARDRESAE